VVSDGTNIRGLALGGGWRCVGLLDMLRGGKQGGQRGGGGHRAMGERKEKPDLRTQKKPSTGQTEVPSRAR